MNREMDRPEKLFTVEEANRMLPLIRAIARDLAELSAEVGERRDRLKWLRSGRKRSADDPYSSEVAQIEEELEKDAARLNDYVQELHDLGVEPKGLMEGLVDFPAEMDGRIVYLCWKLDEPEVLYWHEIADGFAGRQPLTADSLADGISGGDEADPLA